MKNSVKSGKTLSSWKPRMDGLWGMSLRNADRYFSDIFARLAVAAV
ncbi:MAG: hypothetical protein LBK43_06150 [Treponema sp.]|nr:hypothetical protein [Treponema sp.]